jgi:hypothetical protein
MIEDKKNPLLGGGKFKKSQVVLFPLARYLIEESLILEYSD